MIHVVGDIHGRFDILSRLIHETVDTHGSQQSFVQVGDFGIGFDTSSERRWMNALNDDLVKFNSHLYVLRGNHDNPSLFDPNYRWLYSNITFVADHTLIQIDGKNCFFAGGALSIDRVARTQGLNYWIGEAYQFNKAQYDAAVLDSTIDILFTHEVFHACSPFTLVAPILDKYCSMDARLQNDLIVNQAEMGKLWSEVSVNNPEVIWVHGHYHASHKTVKGNQITYSLAINELLTLQ